MAEDLNWILPKIQYMGKTLTNQAYQAWASQFPRNLQAAAVQIVCKIADHYYISTSKYFEALDELIGESDVALNGYVAFCKWQRIGKSAPRVSHDLQNQAHWRICQEIDLDADEKDWPVLNRTCSWVIVADDFVGSGKTISKLFKVPSVIDRILAKYPWIKIRILLVAGFETGLRQVYKAIKTYEPRVKVIVSHLFKEEDRCFTTGSRVFPDVVQRNKIRQFCSDVATKYYPSLPAKMIFGHCEIGALVVFFCTIAYLFSGITKRSGSHFFRRQGYRRSDQLLRRTSGG
jgi:hypothetical protein